MKLTFIYWIFFFNKNKFWKGTVFLDVFELGYPGSIIYLRIKGIELCKWN